jgi:integrase
MGQFVHEYRLGEYRGRWCVVWHEHEKRRRFSLPLSRSRPKVEADAALNAWVRKREAARLVDRSTLTIGEIYAAYIEDRRKEGKNINALRWNWNSLAPTFGPLRPADLALTNITVDGEQRTICHKFAVELSERGIARDTIWDRLARLRVAINWAFKRGLIAERPYVWVPQKGKPRDIVAEEAEVLRILDGCRMPHVRLFVLLASGTGARKTAILQLTWDQVDFERRIIDFRDRRQKGILDKSGQKGRSVVEFGIVLDLALREAKEVARSCHVIEFAGGPVKDVKKGLTAAIERAGLKHRKIGAHVLRHSTATWLADENVDMRKIQKMLGHRNIKTTDEIYAKYRRGYLSEAAAVIDLKLRRRGS